MSRHESVSCDSCMKANFKGRRYKCLICYDYDLCAACHEAGVTTGRHSTEHPMQCILTRSDFELFYGGDSVPSDHPQSFTCPYCGNMGYTDSTLSEHVTVQHIDSSAEVICPICAALPGGDPNLVCDDFHAHLALEHRVREPFDVDTMGTHRTRRVNMARRGARSRHYTPSGTSTTSSNSSSLPMDPIAELLSHLSGVHTRLNMRNPPQQLREIQMQFDAERALRIPESLSSYREHIQRLPRRTGAMYEPHSLSTSASNASASSESSRATTRSEIGAASSTPSSKTLLSRYLQAEKLTGKALEDHERLNAEHSLFVQDVLLATLSDTRLTLNESDSSALTASDQSQLLSFDTLLDSKDSVSADQQQASSKQTNDTSTSNDRPDAGS